MRRFFIKISLYSIAVFALNLAIGGWLRTYETQDLKSEGVFFSELRWEEYYALQNPIDVLILGSSHAYRSYHPGVIKERGKIQNEVFNFGSSAQSPVTGYYVLEEVLQKHKPKVVILDAYVMALTSDDQLDNGRINYRPMQSGKSKLDFLKSGFGFSEQIKMLGFPAYVYRDHFKHKINKILGRSYLPTGKGKYDKMGFVYNSDTLVIEKLKYDNQFSRFEVDADAMTAKNLAYLRKIITRCQAADITVVLMSAPMPEVSVSFMKEYNQASDIFAEIAEEYDVLFHDFNRKRSPYLKDEFHFYDDDHLNYGGAVIFSKEVGEILQTIN